MMPLIMPPHEGIKSGWKAAASDESSQAAVSAGGGRHQLHKLSAQKWTIDRR